ncbi:IclR family transcriptional regulator [Roseomonas sp. HJA6]|uniref:IclR family transcriptional regulator n=1 Tax=Roseomonas alba TaxID=2846776 RepID=A0ABS7A8Z7_9PROT|nr:IclR family transcriptional regulator [Neoroseomonas alba]MBW6398207.1 IclR family transcriptional regulator [Neoroseomonas alba]
MPASEAVPDLRERPIDHDPMRVQSVDKAFRVLRAFDETRPSLSLTQIAAAAELDKSAAQRFTHTLVALGYLRKDPATKRFELTVRTLDLGFRYVRTNALVGRARPYLLHISNTTEETVNLTVPDDTEVVFVSRITARHVINADIVIGARTPVYCSAPGIAMLARLPIEEAMAILRRCDRRQITPNTVWRLEDLREKLMLTAARGYATAFEELHHGDLSVAAAIVDAAGRPVGAINIATLRSRMTPEAAEQAYVPVVVDAARAVSRNG